MRRTVKPNVADLLRIVDAYLAGAQGFWDFHSSFMNVWIDGNLSDEDIDRWDPMYELVACNNHL